MTTRAVLRFALDKETKGTFRFKEVDENGKEADPYLIGTLYIRKSAFVEDLEYSTILQVTIEPQGT